MSRLAPENECDYYVTYSYLILVFSNYSSQKGHYIYLLMKLFQLKIPYKTTNDRQTCVYLNENRVRNVGLF